VSEPKPPWREWASVTGKEDVRMSDLYNRPISSLEDYVMAECGVREWVPGYWSDWFSTAAMVLALLYEWRGRERGKSVEEWLHLLVQRPAADSDTWDRARSMLGMVEGFVRRWDEHNTTQEGT
jgi:hypothetical protein